jgi:hypothetical protein
MKVGTRTPLDISAEEFTGLMASNALRPTRVTEARAIAATPLGGVPCEEVRGTFGSEGAWPDFLDRVT